MGKALLIVGIIVALLGLGYLLMPASLPALGLAGTMEQILGVVLLVIGIVLIWKKK